MQTDYQVDRSKELSDNLRKASALNPEESFGELLRLHTILERNDKEYALVWRIVDSGYGDQLIFDELKREIVSGITEFFRNQYSMYLNKFTPAMTMIKMSHAVLLAENERIHFQRLPNSCGCYDFERPKSIIAEKDDYDEIIRLHQILATHDKEYAAICRISSNNNIDKETAETLRNEVLRDSKKFKIAPFTNYFKRKYTEYLNKLTPATEIIKLVYCIDYVDRSRIFYFKKES